VSKKKPDPEIYNLALEKTGFAAEECIVIEDSWNGVTAANSAGMNVVATTNFYTQQEDLSAADIVVTCLGDPEGELGQLTQGGNGLNYDGVLRASQLMDYFSD
jgi:beta-phosphoglucomutase-like phosphatase (HAD superfamily)